LKFLSHIAAFGSRYIAGKNTKQGGMNIVLVYAIYGIDRKKFEYSNTIKMRGK